MGCEEDMDIDYEYYDWLNKMRERLAKIPLSNFLIEDLPSILRVTGFREGEFRVDWHLDKDLERLENLFPEIKAQEPHVVFDAES